ncbi:MAG: hypothetical protein COX80_04845 [Candidatus Magasanikbacteria bacterium CG_4_10_14_0_2_um_filter_33_14]|uniref:Glycosyltransferase RgtA/B/C/D-like domain-containing protein n=1 Tax=Candidatus Magasanikbacteria bacterium CG_4_10_14_0_2_um_filter_33_14 TaxID=1974636 RepID=A0A2M7V934_9BACT|nr:MAG: hypothetical protein COX80_04845 [Candidatus Magasanikbacteria bacterium CG_4_10_14_0_2_um_filter_33_14]
MKPILKKYITLPLLITILVLFSIWYNNSPIFGVFSYTLYTIFFGYTIGNFFLDKENKFWKTFFGIISLISFLVISLSIVYWFSSINKLIVSLVFSITSIIIFYLTKNTKNPEIKISIPTFKEILSYINKNKYAILIFLLQLLLFYIFFKHRQEENIISPWTSFSYKMFSLFFLLSAVLIYFLQKSKNKIINLILLVTHFAIIYNIILIIFSNGFGFDSHIHEAAEKWISEKGSITPKEPYYIGQYVWVVATHFISKLPIQILDRSLVPLLSSILLPLLSFFILTKNNLKKKIYPAILFLPLIPLSFFTFSTPTNLTLIMSFIVGSWIWYETNNGTIKTNILGLLISSSIIVTHPIIGLPIFFIYLSSILLKKITTKYKKLFYTLYTLLLSAIVPSSLYINSLLHKDSLILSLSKSNLKKFLNIFKRPNYIHLERGDMALQTLYHYRDILLPMMLLLLVFGIYLAIRKYKQKISYFFIATFCGLFLSAFFIISSIEFKNVISYDQSSYGMRLLNLSLVLLLPFFIISIREIFLNIKNYKIQILSSFLFAFIFLISWYFTYPTFNKVSIYTGQNLRKADLIAAKFIDERNNGQKDYIVITNQAVATAALQLYGFENTYISTFTGPEYFYSIPTGGPLYQYFLQMIYSGTKKEYMEQAMLFAGVKKAYFIHTNYWSPAKKINNAARESADNWWGLDNERVWVYEYLLEEN